MTYHGNNQVQRRRKLHADKRRKKLLLLLALVLAAGSGALLFHRDTLYALPEILSWLKENRTGEVLAFSPPSSPRGDIYDRNFRRLAATYDTYALYARPLEMEDPAQAAGLLEPLLGLEKNTLLPSLKSERGFVWLAKGIGHSLADTIKERNIRGIYQVVESKRFYPNKECASHAVGFVGNGQGLDGVEFEYNALLRGEELNTGELQALHFQAADISSGVGPHLVLNIDLMVQAGLEQFLQKRARITGAERGAVLLMDANSGAILAMASYPAFNPNNYWDFSSTALTNHALTEPVYPGELGLIFQQAAAIELKNEKAEEGRAREKSGEAAAPPVLAPETLKRKNISEAPPVTSVAPDYLAGFLTRLGFDSKPRTDIPLKNEVSTSAFLHPGDLSFHASALRLLTGFTALVNGGRLVHPHLLASAFPDQDPVPVATTLGVPAEEIILHPDTSGELNDFLAEKWLKRSSRNSNVQSPMFLETHRFAAASKNSDQAGRDEPKADSGQADTGVSQSLLLGAIPGRKPLLTLVVLLSSFKAAEGADPESLEDFGRKLSLMRPGQDLIKKMLFVAERAPLVPTPDFWARDTAAPVPPLPAVTPEKKTALSANTNKTSMPDVTGKSLRAGLQALQHFNLELKLVGSGRIVSQHPPPGAELKDGGVCVLKMAEEI
jgi:cell division protein FtsI (penicillin-binding protein 3)